MEDALLHSLMYVGRYYGSANSPEALIHGLPLTAGRLTPSLLPRAAQRAGLEVSLQQIQTISQLDDAFLPVILLLKDPQLLSNGVSACVLLSMDQQNAQIIRIDQGWEIYSIPCETLDQQLSGDVFLTKKMYRYDERAPQVLHTHQGHWFWQTLWRSKAIYRDVLFASILINCFALSVPLFTRLVYDKVVPNLAFDTLWVLVVGVAVIFVFDLGLKFLRSYMIDLAGKKSDVLMSAQLFDKVMRMEFASKPASVGAFSRQIQEFEAIREFFTSSTIAALVDVPFALLFLLCIALLASEMVWIPLLTMLILTAYSLSIQASLRRTVEEGSRLATQKSATLIESMAGLETLKLFAAQSQFQYRWEDTVTHMANWGMKTRRLTDGIHHVAGFMTQTTYVGMLILGVYMIAQGELSMGGLIAVSLLSSRALSPLIQLSVLSARYNQAKSALGQIESLMALPDEQAEHQAYLQHPMVAGEIKLDNVEFKYPGSDQLALNKLNLHIAAGEKVAVIGRIGSGKTTLQRILMGLYRPSAGCVSIDGTNIEQVHRVDIRRNIGCVPQESLLFYGTIRDNISLGRPQTEDHDILLAAQRAGVTSFTQQDSQGLQRQVGEGGQLLSGGQRQAVCIARAFLSNPNILLMDEPTSAMDNRSERHIKQQLAQLSEHQTLILLTHKTSMLDVVDRLIVMDQGHIIADGPKEQVLQHLMQSN